MVAVTQTAGGRIRGAGTIAITCRANSELAVNDPVSITGDYIVAKCNGTKPCVGFVDVANVKRSSDGVYPVVDNPGQVTVAVRGNEVRTLVAGATIAAGALVGYNSSGDLVTQADDVSHVGIALMGGDEDDEIDVVITGAAIAITT